MGVENNAAMNNWHFFGQALFEAAQMPIKRYVDKKAVVHLHNGILLGHKKEWNLTICGHMDGPKGYYAKWNKSVRERWTPYDFTYM